MSKGDLGEPVGAIWVKNFKLHESIREFVEAIRPICERCHATGSITFDSRSLNDAIKAHTMAVKVKSLKAKFIAIENSRKREPTQPDYFLHVYQTHTGATASYPFRVKPTEES